LCSKCGPKNKKKQKTLPKVTYPADKEEGRVPHGDERIFAEQDGLSPHCGLGELGKHNPSHTGLNQGKI
jgi:hypothetical protein